MADPSGSSSRIREESKPGANDADRQHIFFPHLLAQRTTQWERGNDPMTQFAFTSHCKPRL